MPRADIPSIRNFCSWASQAMSLQSENPAKDQRLRQAVKPDYISALGMAAWSFASLEWNVAWCCEKIKPGSLRRIVDEEMAAGIIAKRFIDLARNAQRSPEREELKVLAREFSSLVQLRNLILHGKPCAGPNDEPRLSSTAVLEIPDLEHAADTFALCSSSLNRPCSTASWRPTNLLGQPLTPNNSFKPNPLRGSA